MVLWCSESHCHCQWPTFDRPCPGFIAGWFIWLINLCIEGKARELPPMNLASQFKDTNGTWLKWGYCSCSVWTRNASTYENGKITSCTNTEDSYFCQKIPSAPLHWPFHLFLVAFISHPILLTKSAFYNNPLSTDNCAIMVSMWKIMM